MSTQRFSGELRIRVTYVDIAGQYLGQYRCHIVAPGGDRITIFVGARLEHGSGICVDSPESFDDAARASVAFADHETGMKDGYSGSEWSKHAAYDTDLTGIHVGRSLATAWPKEKAQAV